MNELRAIRIASLRVSTVTACHSSSPTLTSVFSPLCIFAPSRTACQLSMTALARSCGTHDPRGESR